MLTCSICSFDVRIIAVAMHPMELSVLSLRTFHVDLQAQPAPSP